MAFWGLFMNYHDQTKRILIISFLFEPNTRVGAKRFSFLSRILKGKYPELHVLTLKEKCIPQKDNFVASAGTIHRAGMYPAYPFEVTSIFKRVFNRLWVDYLCLVDQSSGWILPAFFKGLKIIKANKINLIIATGPPFSPMVVAFLLSFLGRTKLILDYRDPWTNRHQRYSRKSGRRINEMLERLCIGRASAVVFCSRIMMENFRDSLGKYTKATYHVITNGFYNRDTTEPLSLGNGTRNMVYAGNLYGERSIEILAKPLFHLLNEGAISKDNFCCHIFGKLKNEDREVIKKYGFHEIIKEHASVPYEQIIKYLKGADILFLPSGSDVNYAIPYKFFDYLSVKRPILAVAPQNSGVAEMMNQIDCGRLALINSQESILRNLRAMILEEKEYTYFGSDLYRWETIGLNYTHVIEKTWTSDQNQK